MTATPTSSGVENWLLEGFADYVALRDVDLPLSRTAGQIIALVRKDGVPDALPSRLDLDPGAADLGAAYEASWLVCVTLADHGGEEALVAFYEAVLGGADLEAELRSRFGWTIADLTHAWQDELRSIAGARARARDARRTGGSLSSPPWSAPRRSCCWPLGWCRGTPSRAAPRTRSSRLGLQPGADPAGRGLRPVGPGLELELPRRIARRRLLARLQRDRSPAGRPDAGSLVGAGDPRRGRTVRDRSAGDTSTRHRAAPAAASTPASAPRRGRRGRSTWSRPSWSASCPRRSPWSSWSGSPAGGSVPGRRSRGACWRPSSSPHPSSTRWWWSPSSTPSPRSRTARCAPRSSSSPTTRESRSTTCSWPTRRDVRRPSTPMCRASAAPAGSSSTTPWSTTCRRTRRSRSSPTSWATRATATC